MKKISNLALYPLFFGLLPALTLLTDNANTLSLEIAYRSFLVLLLVNGLVFLVFRLLLRSWHRAGLVTAFLSFLFFNYKELVFNLGALFAWKFFYAVALLAAGVILGTYALIRLVRKPQAFTRALNFISICMIAANLAYSGFYNLQGRFSQSASAAQGSPVVSIPKLPSSQAKPDIYYIILDGYGRADVLNELFEIDNQPFLNELERRGFFIAGQSHSNYSQTLLSLSSSLNMNYLDQLANLPPDFHNRAPIMQLVLEGQVSQILRQQGYTFAALETGYAQLNIKSADVFIHRQKQLNEFEERLLNNSFLLYYNNELLKRLRYEALKEEFNQLETYSSQPGPKFTFAHFLIPHPPFLFDRNGVFQAQNDGEIGDGSYFPGTKADYRAGYREQLLYANQRVLAMIDHILAQPGPKPVIILQGDHGSGLHLDMQSYERTCVRERLSIFNAYLLPEVEGAGALDLPPAAITPVNTFRYLLNRYFAAGLPLLEDISYFSDWPNPYTFHRLSPEQLDTRCEPWMGKEEPGS